MHNTLGIDTSNYTSSAAVYAGGTVVANEKQLLPVKAGQLGLRQNDALFHHTVNLPEVLNRALAQADRLEAVGVSVRPRDVAGSYMPCFLAGKAQANAVAAALGIPLYEFSHQCGHIAAAAYSAGAPQLLGQPLLAFHVSGGTTDALLVEPDPDRILRCTQLAGSLDLKAGQAIDRVGRMLGLPFPAGPALEMLAETGVAPEKPRPTLKGMDCCLSGLENQCRSFLERGAAPADVARYCLDAVCCTLDAMAKLLQQAYPGLPLLFAGGVMSNAGIRRRFTEKYGAYFAQPAFSADNAAGIALLAAKKYEQAGV